MWRKRGGKWVEQPSLEIEVGEADHQIQRMSDAVLLKNAEERARAWQTKVAARIREEAESAKQRRPKAAGKKKKRATKRLYPNRRAEKKGPLGMTWADYWKHEYRRKRTQVAAVEKDRERARRARAKKRG